MKDAEELFKQGLMAETTGRLREAMLLYQDAFEHGSLVAGYRLGISDGWGPQIMTRDAALVWLQRASDSGHVLAMALLARAM